MTAQDLSATPADEDSGFAELTVEKLMSQLEVRRAELAGSASCSAEFFRISVRGGTWTAANWRMVAESLRSKPSDAASKRF